MELLDQIPGLREAVDHERYVRELAYLELPESICGIDVAPLTLGHVLKLGVVGNPFVVGGNLGLTDAAALLVALTGHTRGWRRWIMLRRLGEYEFRQIAGEIIGFIEEAFQDAPASSGDLGGTSYFSSATSLVDLFAREYGWSERDILAIPVKRLFQYIKAITRHHNPDAVMFNPSDKVRGQWLAQINNN
jgi:hypothetical protein